MLVVLSQFCKDFFIDQLFSILACSEPNVFFIGGMPLPEDDIQTGFMAFVVNRSFLFRLYKNDE